MVPIRLKVQNFLSYGVNAPVLDFSSFKVACLSGANGQGKSALLEAMTWALWGEARKNSGALIRTGANLMVVEFTFEVEGVCYLVERTYAVSESGKTQKPSLTLRVQGEHGEWKDLTESGIKATQARLTGLLGLDYDTFVNASFLMQGRSDEFTRKTPTSRKEVLANILDLSRYATLEAAAKEKRSEFEGAAKGIEARRVTLAANIQKDAEVEAQVDLKEEESTRLRESLEAFQVALEAAQRELATATQAVQAVQGWKESAEALQRDLNALAEEENALELRIHSAKGLVANLQLYTQEAERYEAVVKEQEMLLEKSAQHAGLKHQLETNERHLSERRAALEAERSRLQERVLALEQQVNVHQGHVTAGQNLQARRDEAFRDAAPLESLRKAEREHTARERQLSALETELREARQAAESRLNSLRAEDKRLQEAQKTAHVDPDLLTQTRLEAERLPEVERDMERVRDDGTAAGKALENLRHERDHLQKEVERIEKQRAVVLHPDSPRCPTCGTDLTPSHRRMVLQELDEEKQHLTTRTEHALAELHLAESRVEHLRAEFIRLRDEHKALREAATRLATLEERLMQEALLHTQREALKREGLALRTRLEAEPFDAELHAKLEAIRRDIELHPFDPSTLRLAEAASERLNLLDAQLVAWQRSVQSLNETQDALARQKTMLSNHVREVEHDAQLARLLDLKRDLALKIEALGFNPLTLSTVSSEVRRLQGAPARLRDVVHAQTVLADAATSRANLARRRGEIQASLVDLRLKLTAEPRLREEEQRAREDVERASARVRTAQKDFADLQLELGALKERREAYRMHCAEYNALEKDLEDAKKQLHLFSHLVQAFGSKGIPALIIEHTVPEIEYRANELLDPLSQGKLHLKIVTSRTKVNGQEAETLEVIVLDDTGSTRPYETYSGGEAFRINFALRLALSHILAERAGVRIRTLVIDEGFGTQDPEGVTQLIEAIRTVQDSFDKILVISHLDEIKEAFPVRIEVRKEPLLGSTFDVIGVG